MSRVAEKQESFVTRLDEKQQHFMGKTTEELKLCGRGNGPFERSFRPFGGRFESF